MARQPVPGIKRVTGVDSVHFGFDELLADGARIHIERMNRDHMWMIVCVGDQEVTLNFHAKKNTLYVNVDAAGVAVNGKA